MSKSRMISTAIWDDDYFADLDPQGKLAWMYILTNPVSEMKPFYKLPSKRMSDFRLGFDFEFYLKKFENDKKIKIKDGWIYLINWMKHQRLNDNQMKGVENYFKELDPKIREYFQNSNPSESQKDDKEASGILSNPSKPFETLPNDTEPLPNPSDKLSQAKLSQANSSKISKENSFEEFWNLYPRKIGKGEALKKYEKAIQRVSEQDLIQGLRENLATFSTDEKYIPYPATWLNQERWQDVAKPKAKTEPEIELVIDPETGYPPLETFRSWPDALQSQYCYEQNSKQPKINLGFPFISIKTTQNV